MRIGLTRPALKLSLAIFLSITPLTGVSAEKKPNVLLIISDDLNTFLSGMGHPECKTPHLDQLAKSGVTFTRAYSQFPLCGPSRASMMSGQYPLKNGVVGNGGRVNPKRVTLPRYFRQKGYWVTRVSKIYHMGIPIDILQGTSGRDHSASWDETFNIHALETLTPGKAEDFLNPKNNSVFPKERKKWLNQKAQGKPYRMPFVARGQYAVVEVADENQHLLPDAMAADRAIEVLRTRSKKSQPFFLAVGFVRPHFPFVATEKSIQQYQLDSVSLPKNAKNDHDDLPPQAIGAVKAFDKTPLQKIRRGYYGAVSFMDQQVGRLMAELRRLNLQKNTVVIFVSDHGYLMGEHRMWKKNRLWEEAIRVPLIISAPGKKQNLKSDHFVELIDLYPTLTDLVGLPREENIQGQSLVPLLDDPMTTLDKNDAFIHTSAGYGLRKEKWAYMWYPARRKNKVEGFMLYDMEKDPQQFKNLAGDPKWVSIKEQLHERLLKRIEAAKK